MLFDEYLTSLKQEPRQSAYIELDRSKELVYMTEHAVRFRDVARRIPDLPQSQAVLDIGTTPFTFFIKASHPHYDVHTLDMTDFLKDRCEGKGIRLHTGSLAEPLPIDDDTFDLVVFTEVLEHIFAPPSKVLGEVRRVMKPGGKLILSVPNIAVLHKRVKLLFGMPPLKPADSRLNPDSVHGLGHLHEYTRKEVVSIVTGCGFKLERIGYLRQSVRDALRNPHRKVHVRLIRAAYHATQALWPAFGSQIVAECRK